MLGLCALHLLMLAITEYHNISMGSAVISCDIKQASNYHGIIKGEYDQEQKVQISGGTSMPPSRLIQAISLMYTFMATWTTIYHGLN